MKRLRGIFALGAFAALLAARRRSPRNCPTPRTRPGGKLGERSGGPRADRLGARAGRRGLAVRGRASRKERPSPHRPSPRRRPSRRAAAGPRSARPPTPEEDADGSRSGRRGRARCRRPTSPSRSPRSRAPAAPRSGVPPVLIPIYQRPPPLRPRPPGPRGAGRDQRDRDRLRHQPQRLLGRRDRLDAVHPLELGNATGSTPTATGSRTPTTPKTRSSPPPAT